MTKRTVHDRRILKADLAFGLLAFASIFTAFTAGFDSTPAIPEASQPLVVGAILVGIMLVLSLIIVRFADIDRRCSEEYVFQLVANAAVVGIMVALFANLLLSFDFLFGRWLPEPSAAHLNGIMMGGWAAGYFAYRLRGTVG